MNRVLKLGLMVVCLISLVGVSATEAGEITDLEWNILGQLEVTYYVGASGQSRRVDCTVSNAEKKPIGGGYGYAQGGVAVVRVGIPKKYQGNKGLQVSCQP